VVDPSGVISRGGASQGEVPFEEVFLRGREGRREGGRKGGREGEDMMSIIMVEKPQ